MMAVKNYMINLDPRDHAELKRWARDIHVTVSALIRGIVRDYLDERKPEKRKRKRLRGGNQMGTYRQIQTHIRHTDRKWAHTCWIAHVKELNHLPLRQAWNRSGAGRENPCPRWARPLIENAFKHFGLL